MWYCLFSCTRWFQLAFMKLQSVTIQTTATRKYFITELIVLISNIPRNDFYELVCYVLRHSLEGKGRDTFHLKLPTTTFFFVSFTAVASAPKEHKGAKWYITALSTVVILLIVVALCVYAPCGCLWKRHRSEFDVNCPITASQKGMCGKCYLHKNATTKTMTYEERPHHVSVTMATNDSHHCPSSGNLSSQEKIITNGNINCHPIIFS